MLVLTLAAIVCGLLLDIHAVLRVGRAIQNDPMIILDLVTSRSRLLRSLGGYIGIMRPMLGCSDGRAVYTAMLVGMYAFAASSIYTVLA